MDHSQERKKNLSETIPRLELNRKKKTLHFLNMLKELKEIMKKELKKTRRIFFE